MKLLIYGNRKQDDDIYDISTPEKEEAAYRAVFETLNGYWQCYAELEETISAEAPALCDPCSKSLHRLCEHAKRDAGCTCNEKTCPNNEPRLVHERRRVKSQQTQYKKALEGDIMAIKYLMNSRKDYEYESFRIEEAQDPIAALKKVMKEYPRKQKKTA